MIATGGTNIVKAYLGQTELTNIAIGDELLLSSEEPLPEGVVQIEYIEATGTQYIDLNVVPTSSSELAIDGDFTYPANGTCAFSANTAWNFNQYTLFKSGTNYYWGVSQTVFQLESKRQLLEVKSAALYADGVLKRNGTWKDVYANTSLKIFAHGSIAAARMAKGKLYGVRFSDNNLKILDMIPVRVGTTGYLYNKVSRTLFGNSGTDDFLLGNDIT